MIILQRFALTTILLVDLVFALQTASTANPLARPHEYSPAVESWQLTTRAKDRSGRVFGLTFLLQRIRRSTADDIFAASISVMDDEARVLLMQTRLERVGQGLASASGKYVDVSVGDWRLSEDQMSKMPIVHVTARAPEFAFALTASAERRPVGLVGSTVSITKLLTTGTVSLRGISYEVAGTSWFDHDRRVSTSGRMDRFQIQFLDGRELLVQVKRDEDEAMLSASLAILVRSNGATERAGAKDIYALRPLNLRWASPQTGVSYPALWRLVIPKWGLDLAVVPELRGQEIVPFPPGRPFSFGLVDVSAAEIPNADRGYGFVRLSGYGGSKVE
jgi:predicted secreted hydrolase